MMSMFTRLNYLCDIYSREIEISVVTPPPYFASPLPTVNACTRAQVHENILPLETGVAYIHGHESIDQHSIGNLSMYTPTPSSYNSLRMVRRTTTVKTQATQTQSEIDAEIARANALELEYELNTLNREQSQFSSKYALSGVGDSHSGFMDGLQWTSTTSYALDGDGTISRPRTQATETMGDYDDEVYSTNPYEYITPSLIDASTSLDYLTLSPRATRKIISRQGLPLITGDMNSGRKVVKLSSSNRHSLGQHRKIITTAETSVVDRLTSHQRASTAAPETRDEVNDEEEDDTQFEEDSTCRACTSDHLSNKEILSSDRMVKKEKKSTVSSESNEMQVNMQSEVASEIDKKDTLERTRLMRSQVCKAKVDTNEAAHVQRESKPINSVEQVSIGDNSNELSTETMNTMSRKNRKLMRSSKSIRSSIESTSPPSSSIVTGSTSNVPHVTSDSVDSVSNQCPPSSDISTITRREVNSGRSKHRSHSRSSTSRGHVSSSQHDTGDGDHRTRPVSTDHVERRVDLSTSDSDLPACMLPKLPVPIESSNRRHSLSAMSTDKSKQRDADNQADDYGDDDDDRFFTFSRPIKLPSPSTCSLKRSTGKLNTSEHTGPDETEVESKSHLPFPAQEKLLLSEGIKLPSEFISIRKVTQTVTLDKARELTKSLTNLAVDEGEGDQEEVDDDDEEKRATCSAITRTTTAATLTDEVSNVSLVSPDSDRGELFIGAQAAAIEEVAGGVGGDMPSNETTSMSTITKPVTLQNQQQSGSSSNYVTATSASLDRGSGTIETLTSVNTPFETVSSCTASYYSSSSSVGRVETFEVSAKSSTESFWSSEQHTPGQVDVISSDTDVTGTQVSHLPLFLSLSCCLFLMITLASLIDANLSFYVNCACFLSRSSFLLLIVHVCFVLIIFAARASDSNQFVPF